MVDLLARALAHFVGSAIRESDRYDVIDGDFPGAKNFQIALHQNQRLACAGTGSNGKMSIESVRGCGLFRFQLAGIRI